MERRREILHSADSVQNDGACLFGAVLRGDLNDLTRWWISWDSWGILFFLHDGKVPRLHEQRFTLVYVGGCRKDIDAGRVRVREEFWGGGIIYEEVKSFALAILGVLDVHAGRELLIGSVEAGLLENT